MIVVCGIDGSANAQHALQWSADLVAGTGGEVIAVHAVGLVEELEGETVPSASHRREIEDLCVTVWCAQLAAVGWHGDTRCSTDIPSTSCSTPPRSMRPA